MAFIDEFSDMLNDTCEQLPLTGRDSYAKPTYGTPVPYDCRLVRKFVRVKNKDGEEVTSGAQLWIKGTTIINPEDKFKLSDLTERYVIITETFQDETSNPLSHTKVYLT